MPDIYVNPKENKTKKPYHEAGALAAFAVHPDNIHFEMQQEDEEIILFLRQHPVVNVPWIIVAILLLLAPLVLRFFPLLDFLPVRFQIVSILVWYLVVLAFIFERFISWLFNIYIVTNERVVDIDFPSLIYKEVTDAELGRIQDVTFRQGGVVRALFNYGDVLVQTAGTVPNIEFLAVPRPADVTRTLQEVREMKGRGA